MKEKNLAELLYELAAGAPKRKAVATTKAVQSYVKTVVTHMQEQAKKEAESGSVSASALFDPPMIYDSTVTIDKISGYIMTPLMADGFQVSVSLQNYQNTYEKKLHVMVSWAKAGKPWK